MGLPGSQNSGIRTIMSNCLGPLAPKLSESHSPSPPDTGGDATPHFQSQPGVPHFGRKWAICVPSFLPPNPGKKKRNTSSQMRRLRKLLRLPLGPGGAEAGRRGDPSKSFSKPQSALSKDLGCKMPGCGVGRSSKITEPELPGFTYKRITWKAV